MSGEPVTRYIGQTFGYLTVIGTVRKEVRGRKRSYLRVLCVCGTEKEILVHNMTGGTKSCGCKSSELKGWNVKHGLHKTRIYQTHADMKQRCLNPNNARYHRYGGRGITICDEWREDFMAFYKWALNNGYSETLTIERVDNNGNYEPQNCRWATVSEQLANRDFSRMGRKRIENHSNVG